MRKLNKDQRFILSEFYIGLSIAWLSVGVISPLFIPVKNVIQLIAQVVVSSIIAVILVLSAIHNLENRRKK